ncbi:EAL domain-containing protein [Dokdonella soli]|uniref:EAL domain-containing response regulator n=1 Tax=Dokdonella soli TaxID=529810 RepID=A0ABN1IRC4_9GAMM
MHVPDFRLLSPERQRLFQVQLPQRLARLRQRGERLGPENWDINALVVFAEDAAFMAGACRAVDAGELADCLDALHGSLAALLDPPRLPGRSSAARVAELVAELSRQRLPEALDAGRGQSGAVAIAGPTHELGFPLLVVPPRDHWARFGATVPLPVDDNPDEPPIEGVDSDLAATADAYRILIVEDDRSQLLFAESILRNAGMVTLAVAEALDALDALERFRPDLVLMDLHMPECDGIDLTALIRQRGQFAATPIVFLSADHAADKCADALRAGGDAFLTKPVRPRQLIDALRGHVSRAREQRGRVDESATASHETTTRERLLRRLSQCLAMDDAGTRSGGLLVFAMEGAAARQAGLGAARFAALLAEIGAFLITHAAPRDLVAIDAVGSFLLLNPDRDANQLEAHALNLRDRIAREPFSALEPGDRALFDVGVCAFAASARDAEAMRGAALNAIDGARADGRSGVFVVRGIDAAIDSELVERIRFALDGTGFELLFQPIVSLLGEEQEQFQVLLRLRGDDHRLHTAAEVIPVATEAGLVGALDRWVLEQCAALVAERARHGPPPRLFVSQSIESARDGRGIARLGDLLRTTGIDGSSLVLELRVRDVTEAPAEIARYAKSLQALGVGLALSGCDIDTMDDRLLRALPAGFVKIAPRYLHADDEVTRDELHALVKLAHENGQRVIAPRVEDARGAAALWAAGVDFVQGNFVQPADRDLAFDFHASAI